ncbi:MAG: hypothetical protein AB8G17_13185 [Gammaproteobacteria bacterium]
MPHSHTRIFATAPLGVRDSIRTAENMMDDPFFDNAPGIDVELSHQEKIVIALRQRMQFKKLAVFSKAYETDDIVARLPVFGLVKLALVTREPGDQTAQVRKTVSFPLGSLATDHVGYASFDLRPLQDIGFLMSLAREIPDSIPVDDVDLTANYLVVPFSDDQFAIDALDKGDVSPSNIMLRLHVEESWLEGRGDDPSLPSMQNPDIQDWRYSPGSFAISPSRLIGDGACEDLYPGDLSTHQFAFHEAVQVSRSTPRRPSKEVAAVRFGYVMDYRTQWFPVGHSLGRILYSLPLAPGEKVKLAIIDYKRSDGASRSESTQARDELVNEQGRDRVVGEVIRASIREKQSGDSMMGGIAASVAAPIGAGVVGSSLGFGGAKKSSKGFRRIAAETTQDLSDGFHQASTAVRELNSTVVTQITQSEDGRYETRSVANHNHCHTLTILYYEVLRHYRTLTSFVGRRPALFVEFEPQDMPDFSNPDALARETAVLAHRAAVEFALRDSRYLAGFEALNRVAAARLRLKEEQDRFDTSAAQPGEAGLSFEQLTVLFHTGNDSHARGVNFTIVKKDGQTIVCRQIHPDAGGDTSVLDTPSHDNWRKHSIDAFVVVPESAVKWQDIAMVRVGFRVRPSPLDDAGEWLLERLQVTATTPTGSTATLVDKLVNHKFSGRSSLNVPVNPPDSLPQDIRPILTDFVSEGDVAARDRLMQHIAAFSQYYQAAAYAGADPLQRSELLKAARLDGRPLTDLIENRILLRDGMTFAFPLVNERHAREALDVADDDERLEASGISVEDLITVPTKGVFADGKLGHCSSCEKIDDTRFWDFQKSPIPGDAPDIAPVSTNSRFQAAQGLTPTALPNSIISMAAPPAAPDPIAMASALKVLGTSDVFRDMSGGEELAKYMTSLSEGTQNMVNAMGGNKRQSDLLKQIFENDDLTAEQKATLAGKTLDSLGTSKAAKSSAASTSAQKPATSSSAGSTDKSTKSSSESVGSSSGEGAAKKPTTPKRSVKPPQAKKSGGALFLYVDTDSQNTPADLLESSLTVIPDGMTPYSSSIPQFIRENDGETSFSRNAKGKWVGQRAVRLHDGSSRTGSFDLRTSITPRVEISGFSDSPGLRDLILSTIVVPEDKFTRTYSYSEGTDSLLLSYRIHYTTMTVGGESWSAALENWQQATEALAFRKLVSVFATDFSQNNGAVDPSDRTWVMGYLEDKPSASIGPFESESS